MKKICPRCNRRLVSISKKYCEVCEAKANDRHKEYKKYRKDIKEQSFYSSDPWRLKREKIKDKDNGCCLLCLNKHRSKPMDTVHHIIELKEDWNKRFEEDNLISLCESCHQVVHNKYKTSDKEQTQNELKSILIKFRDK
ncbi:MAG: HNH endonuclease [Paraclostridium sordellii]